MSEIVHADEIRPRHRWTVEDFHKMVEAGLLTEDSRVELIDGEVVEMAPIGSEHAGKVSRLVHLFSSLAGNRAIVSPQNPIVLGDYSEPQPDIALLRWREDFYENAHPRPQDILLLIEVSDVTARYDRRIKVPMYARHGIPEVWLIDLQRRCVEVYRHPREGQYQQVDRHQTGSVSPQQLPEMTIDMNRLFVQDRER